jgi:hypothetical protein
MVRAADVGAIDILGQRQADTMRALQFGAQGAEREIGREINREMMERGAAQAAIEGGLQNIAGGLGQAGSAAIYGSLGRKGATEDATSLAATPTAEDQMRTETLASLNRTAGAGSGGERAIIAQGFEDIQDASARAECMRQLPPFTTYRIWLKTVWADQHPSDILKEGGMVTGGKFDHKTNPIDIVQQGRKVGEMTGGEVILNPSQQKKLSKESAYFRTLLKKFNKQK